MFFGNAVSYERLSAVLDRAVLYTGLSCVAILLFLFGFPLEARVQLILRYLLYAIAILFMAQEALRYVLAPDFWSHFKSRRMEASLTVLLAFSFLADELIAYLWRLPVDSHNIRDLTLGLFALTQLALFASYAIRWFRDLAILSTYELTPSRLMVFSFLLTIVTGVLLLKLPNATVNGISWLDAVFTATSAVCVTGLSVVDTGTAFTPFGQTILGALIQIGGLGIMTITMSFGVLFSSGLAVRERMVFSELFAEERLGRVGHLLVQVTIFTLSIEMIGAVALYLSRDVQGGFDPRIFLNSLFHSVSAFCNAGFSLFSSGLYDPSVRSNVPFSLVIMALVIIGGIGYPVFYNVFEVLKDRITKVRSSRALIRPQTKMVLSVTGILLVLGVVLVHVLESNHSLQGVSGVEQLRQSLFWSVTSRTVGYHILPVEALRIETCLVLMVLIWIGGSPMSTAGGIKTLTVAVAWLNLVATLKGSKRVLIFNRRIAGESLQKAHAIIFGSLIVLACSVLLLIAIEPEKNKFDLAFEAVAAFGTTGLSRGLTSELSASGKLLLTVLMFVGRLGVIVVLNSFFSRYRPPSYKVLKETIPIS